MESIFFIVGNSRSGTTLVARVLKRHLQVHVLNETHFMEEFSDERRNFDKLSEEEIRRIINQLLVIQNKDYYRKAEYQEYPGDAERLYNLYKAKGAKSFKNLILAFFEYQAEKHHKLLVGDQTPRHVFDIPQLSEMFPEAKFIHMIRDPRAILLSQKKKWKAGIRWKQPKFEIIRTFINYHPITTLVIWKKAVKAGIDGSQRIPRDRVLHVKFEHLVANPKKHVTEICKLLKIDFQEKMLDVGVELTGTEQYEGKKGIQKALAEKWRSNLTRTEIFIADQLAATIMNEFEYKKTNVRPNVFLFFLYLAILPYQLAIAFILNIGRMGNPMEYLRKRLAK